MVRGFLVAVLTLGLFSGASAEIVRTHECERDGIRRTLELVAENASGLPCQVVYSKPMEDQSSTIMWNATHDEGYCEKKYIGYIAKLETKLNWSCSALTNVLPDKSELPQPTSINSLEQSTEKPILSAALPDIERTNELERGITLKAIQRHFPSGHYATSENAPHSGDVSLCPAAGFYIWNTQQPKKPIFEMGRNTVFILNLEQIAEDSQDSARNSNPAQRCNYDIQSTYCLDNQLQGQALASADSEGSLECRRQGSETRPIRRLALISVLSGPTEKSCAANAPAAFTELTTLPVTVPGDDEYGSEGFEMIITENANAPSRRATCRYFRGS